MTLLNCVPDWPILKPATFYLTGLSISNMLKKGALFLFISVVIISCIWFEYSHYFRPVIFAKTISGFDIPINSNVISFHEEWANFNGDGYAISKIKVLELEFGEIIKQCQNNGYHRLPIDQNLLLFGAESIDSLSNENNVGYYKILNSKGEMSLNIVNTETRLVTTYLLLF